MTYTEAIEILSFFKKSTDGLTRRQVVMTAINLGSEAMTKFRESRAAEAREAAAKAEEARKAEEAEQEKKDAELRAVLKEKGEKEALLFLERRICDENGWSGFSGVAEATYIAPHELEEFKEREHRRALRSAIETAQATVVGDTPWWNQVCKGHFPSLNDDVKGSYFYVEPEEVLKTVLDPDADLDVKDDGGTLIVGVEADNDIGCVGAWPLKAFDSDEKVRVASLGHHPSLVTEASRRYDYTRLITLVIEYAGQEYEADCKALNWPEGKPILATLFPGEALPPSHPHDCAEGDVMTVAEAKAKGWKVVKLDSPLS